jgi:CRP/FNR family transcriptional regulator
VARARSAPALLRASVPALGDLPDATIRWLARVMIVRRYGARRVLYHAGEPAAALYFVLSGRIRVVHERTGPHQVLHHEGPGGVLGEIPVFGGGPYPATATAVEATRCAVLPASEAERLLRDEPAFARFALRRMAVRARVLLQRLQELASHGVTARLAAHLLARAEASGDGEITLGMSQAELAEELGTAREVLVRSLRALCALGAIQRCGRARFRVASLASLRAVATGTAGERGA